MYVCMYETMGREVVCTDRYGKYVQRIIWDVGFIMCGWMGEGAQT